MRKKSSPAAPLAAAIVLVLATHHANAQSTDPAPAQPAVSELDKIVVTGSNIPRANSETASPVQVITAADIERSGKLSVGEYLQTLTANGAGSIPKSFGTGFASGGAGVSLRGMGAGSTLVLVNGRRLAPYGLADDGQKVFTDLSSIPTEAVQSIEVLKDGASAIYGSDAIAGVVNIILKSNYQGFAARASYGQSGNDDMAARKVSAIYGVGDIDEGMNMFFTVEAGKNDGVLINSRDDRKWIGTADWRPWGYSVEGSGFLGGWINSAGTNALSSPAGSLRRDDGTYFSLPGCADLANVVNPPDPAGGCLVDAADWRSLVPEEKYVTAFGRATVRMSDNAEAYVEVGFADKKTRFQNTPSGVSGSWGYPGGPVNASSGPGAMLLNAAHPDNPLGYAARPRYLAWDVGPRVTNNHNQFQRLLFGVKGAWGEWDYDIGYLHSATQLNGHRTGYLRYSRVMTVLNDPNSPVGWWRIGDDAHLNSKALYDYISPEISAEATTTLDMLDFRASRALWDLPGGPLSFAFGLEYRVQAVELTPLSYTDIGDIIGLGYSAYRGKEKVGVAFTEVLAPISEHFELSGALRVDSYEGGSTAVTPKLGLKWTPAEWLALRATYGEGFRAPNAAEAGDGGLAAFTTAADPVRCPGGTPAPGASQADCAAPLAVITSPNPGLKPEESKSYTVGFVLNPTKSTSITVDAWQIKRTNEINQELTSVAIREGRVVRNDDNLPGIPNSGTLLAARANYVNSASSTLRGIDFDVRQEFDLGGFGKLAFDMQWSRLNLFRREDGGQVFQYAGSHGNCDTTNCAGTPKDRANAGLTWSGGAWSASMVANYIGSFRNTQFENDPAGCANLFADDSDAPAGCRMPSFTTVDLSAKWKARPGLEFSASIQNVQDKIAPLDPLTYGAMGYNPMHYSGAVGRFFTVGVRYEFK